MNDGERNSGNHDAADGGGSDCEGVLMEKLIINALIEALKIDGKVAIVIEGETNG